MMFCINGKFLSQRITGVQRFAFELTKVIKSKYPKVRVIVPKGTYDLPFDVEEVGKRSGVLWEQIDLPNFLKSIGSPLLINFCNIAPLVYQKNVVTLHDIAFKINPSWFSWSFQAFYNFIIPRLLQKALKVITVSDFSKQEILKHYKLLNKDVSIVHNVYRPTSLPLMSKKPYILFVGSLNPRKNLEGLVRAVRELQVDLKVVGASESSFSSLGLQPSFNIEFLGYKEDSELELLYAEASVFISLSHYEGFNIPVLEALGVGCKVLLSDIAVHRELYEGYVTFTRLNDQSIKEGILKVLEEEVDTDKNLNFVQDFSSINALSQFEKALKGL